MEPIHEIQVPTSSRFLLGEQPSESCSRSQNIQQVAHPKPSAKGNQGITPEVDSGFKSVRPALKNDSGIGIFVFETSVPNTEQGSGLGEPTQQECQAGANTWNQPLPQPDRGLLCQTTALQLSPATRREAGGTVTPGRGTKGLDCPGEAADLMGV